MTLSPKNKGRNSSYLQRSVWPLFFLLFLFFLINPAYADESEQSSDSSKVNTDNNEGVLWYLSSFVQMVLNAAVYPVSAPVQYFINNGVMEKSVELISFGEEKKIIVYPTMNLKPGSQTQLGMTYRHRCLVFDRDYLVLQGSYYANGDVYLSDRYTKQEPFGLPLFVGFRYKLYWDSDASFIIPGTKEAFVQPDSTMSFQWRIGAPLSSSKKLNFELSTSQLFIDASIPGNTKDSILNDEIYPIADRGLYQSSRQYSIAASLVYDDLNFPYAPSKGDRVILSAEYNFVPEYNGLENIEKSDKKHDFIANTLIWQHYFYFGKAQQYILSAREARQSRKFYTDFSWDEALRVWRPENIRETLLERRVLALQFRMENMWEMDKGGAPFNAFPTMSARYPLRGYRDDWAAAHIMGLSAEYRWPIDRFVDGVLFDEYGLHAEKVKNFSFDHFYNSWGFGIRVRMPEMYLFRCQVGFHGLHGVNLILTIAPEFK